MEGYKVKKVGKAAVNGTMGKVGGSGKGGVCARGAGGVVGKRVAKVGVQQVWGGKKGGGGSSGGGKGARVRGKVRGRAR